VVGNKQAARSIGRSLVPLFGVLVGLVILLASARAVAAQTGLLAVSWDPDAQSQSAPNPRGSPPAPVVKTRPAQLPDRAPAAPYGVPVLALGILLLIGLVLTRGSRDDVRPWRVALRPELVAWPMGRGSPIG